MVPSTSAQHVAARLSVAERIAPAWSELPGVAAVVVSGSTARGTADRFSDLELGVYWSAIPSPDVLDRAVDQLDAVLTNRLDRPLATGWFGCDNLQVQGLQVDVAMNTVDTIDAFITAVVDERDLRHDVIELLGMLAEVRALTGHAVVSGWQGRLGVDDGLARSLVQHALRVTPASALTLDLERHNLVRTMNRMLEYTRAGLRALFPLNHRWFPGFKTAMMRLTELERVPQASRARLERGLAGPTADAASTLVAWLDEVFELAERSGAGVETARERLHEPGRTPWSADDLVTVGRRR